MGTIAEGDLLWAIKNHYMMNMKDAEGRAKSRRKPKLAAATLLI